MHDLGYYILKLLENHDNYNTVSGPTMNKLKTRKREWNELRV